MEKETKRLQAEFNSHKCVQCDKETRTNYLPGETENGDTSAVTRLCYCSNEECPNYNLYQF